jgi:hypothetical protein
MKNRIIAAITILLASVCLGQPIPVDSLYLGQTPPGTTPVVFQLPITSGLRPIERIAVSNDGREIYFSELDTYPPTIQRARYFRYENDGWHGPFDLFNGYNAPALSPTDSILYLQTNLSYAFATACYSVRTDTGWTTPQRLFSFDQQSHYTQKTTLDNYYISTNFNGSPLRDLGKVVINGADTTVQTMGRPIDTEMDESDFFIARDESYIMHIRHTAVIPGDVYISYRKADGSWTNSK